MEAIDYVFILSCTGMVCGLLLVIIGKLTEIAAKR